MKEETKLMISKFKIYEHGYDFMGYPLNYANKITFHHLIIPSRLNGPIVGWNCAILCDLTSHTYLHIIEHHDEEAFYNITSELIDMNIKGYLDYENLFQINEILNTFEEEYADTKNGSGKKIIKEIYKKRVLK